MSSNEANKKSSDNNNNANKNHLDSSPLASVQTAYPITQQRNFGLDKTTKNDNSKK